MIDANGHGLRPGGRRERLGEMTLQQAHPAAGEAGPVQALEKGPDTTARPTRWMTADDTAMRSVFRDRIYAAIAGFVGGILAMRLAVDAND